MSDSLVYRLPRVMDVGNRQALNAELEAVASAPGLRLLVLDLSETEFVDSTGLSVLITTLNTSAAVGFTLVIRAVQAPIMRTLEICGLTDLFTIEPGTPAQAAPAD